LFKLQFSSRLRDILLKNDWNSDRAVEIDNVIKWTKLNYGIEIFDAARDILVSFYGIKIIQSTNNGWSEDLIFDSTRIEYCDRRFFDKISRNYKNQEIYPIATDIWDHVYLFLIDSGEVIMVTHVFNAWLLGASFSEALENLFFNKSKIAELNIDLT
jgi:SUKH-3 immunity protein